SAMCISYCVHSEESLHLLPSSPRPSVYSLSLHDALPISPLEGMVGARYMRGRFTAGAGVGAGLAAGFGTPDMRILSMLGLALAGVEPALEPLPAVDSDGDGIPDASDQCRNEAEDLDGFQDGDGCPDAGHDTDGDGMPDKSDGCTTGAEDRDGSEDDDARPDAASVGERPEAAGDERA